MFVHYRTKGIVLKKVDRREADQLFILYTEDFGKIDVLGKAIRKISSKLRAGIGSLYLSDIEFIQGKAFKTLTDAILVSKFEEIQRDLGKKEIALKVVGALDWMVKAPEQDDRIWELLLDIFRELDKKEISFKSPVIIFQYFFWNLLSILGYKPELYNCSICQKRLEPKRIYFSQEEGGIICEKCFPKDKTAKNIGPDAVKILRIIIEKGKETVARLKIEEKDLESLREISKTYLQPE